MVGDAVEVPAFDRERFVDALRSEQEGHMAYPEWLEATWRAGVVWYEVDLEARTCTYRAPDGGSYVEHYPTVRLDPSPIA